MVKNCFVIMGYSIKMDEKGRKYDLDLSYKKIIRPLLDSLRIDCIRADETKNTKEIDCSMYELLLFSDLVIADITTLSPNAMYELGIRYALKPYSTIIIASKDTNIPFDINHIKIFKYEHLRDKIEEKEIERFKNELCEVINNINAMSPNNITDSPVYTHLKNLLPPRILTEKNYFKEGLKRYKKNDSIFQLINNAHIHKEKGEFEDAQKIYKEVLKVYKDDYIIKEIAMCMYQKNTYKSLLDAINFLKENIDINDTVNPEILKTMGTIYKKLWLLKEKKEFALKSLSLYEQSFNIYHSYNSGLNYGLMLLAASKYYEDEERMQMKLLSKYIYKKTKDICLKNYKISSYWINASLEECCFVLNEEEEMKKYKELALSCINDAKNNWKRKKTLKQLRLLGRLKKI